MMFGYRKGKFSLRIGNRQLLGDVFESAGVVVDPKGLLFQYSNGVVGIRIGAFNKIYRLTKNRIKQCFEPIGVPKKVWYQDHLYEYQPGAMWRFRGKKVESKSDKYRIISIDGVPLITATNLVSGSDPIDAIRIYQTISICLVRLQTKTPNWENAKQEYVF